MQSVNDKSSLPLKFNVTARVVSLTQLKHYPVINVERNYNNSSLNISVENFNIDTPIFVNITTQTNADLKNLLINVWLTSNISYNTLNIGFIDKNDWVLASFQQSGKY